MPAKLAAQAVVELVVSADDTASSLQSGDVDVLATPRLIALCEQAAAEAIAGRLGAGQTSVGARVELSHVAPVAVGSTVRATATLERLEGHRFTFAVTVTDRCGLVAAGRVLRVIVDRQQFTDRAR
ncbi:MAG: thioesterase [Actinomycetota bacterium]|nr:thioesterase [Actinomycetota bacterium]